ncbi:demethoxyubiquinone hydroxylase family protein [Variovorax sp. DAIF25]|uniref:demethoxyubiquinone hydroxylase family protein n=1 Tax=Variovorax sp. DAIF25 TaxID=3080983 RepID=UPI003D6B5633
MSSRDTALGGRILKVDHAGEQGAVNIYRAQILSARFTAPALVPQLREFRSHEERHRAVFATELQRRGVRRCRSYWLCGIGGWVLGLVTGLLGRHAIAATTVAVERVVLRHLEAQLRELAGKDEAAVAAIAQIVDEERQHHDQSAAHLEPGRFWSRLLSPVVAASTESVIWLGMRL